MNQLYHIHIKSDAPEDVKNELRELATIMVGLRIATIKWQLHFGSDNRKAMKVWEEKADAWMQKHKAIINP